MDSVRTTRRLGRRTGRDHPACVLPGTRVRSRAGFTLLEVLLATVILAGALAALSQLSTNAVTAGLRIEEETLAALRCQTKLDEILAANLKFVSGQSTEFVDDPGWSWTVTLDDGPAETLAVLTVSVQRSTRRRATVLYTLSRLVSRSSLNARDGYLVPGGDV